MAREIIGVPSRSNSQVAARNQSYKALAAELDADGWNLYMQDLIDLQENREESDYSLLSQPRKSDARLAIDKAHRATTFLLSHVTGRQGNAFLALSTSQPPR